jgi:CBS domain containing-hemolysin-like protein
MRQGARPAAVYRGTGSLLQPATESSQISTTLGLVAVVLLILANGFFVAGEFAIVAVERSRVERLAQEGDRRAGRILRSLRNLSFELSGAQLGITITSLVLGAIAEPTIAALISPVVGSIGFLPDATTLAVSVALAFALATGSQMVFGELVPKNLAIARPYRAAVLFGIPMQAVNRLLRPLILFLNGSANWTVRRLGIEPREELQGVRSMEELGLMIRSSGEHGQIEAGELVLLTRAISFTEKVAADAMIPRVAVAWLHRDDTVDDLRRRSLETGHSRFPVRGDGVDDVVGIVHVKDSFSIPEGARATVTVATITQPAAEVPETMHLEEVLAGLKSTGRPMAVVVDEYGGTAGIVTVNDLVEELLGEVADEHDPVPARVPAPGPTPTLSGMLGRYDVAEEIGFLWPEGRYETLGGFVVATLGRFPDVGEVVPFGDWSFEVVAMEGHRVDVVAAHRPPPVDGEEPS